MYVHWKSNHPQALLRNIPERLRSISSNQRVFDESIPPYPDCSGYKHKLTYNPQSIGRQCGRVVRARALRSRDPGLCSDHPLNLFQVVPGSTSWHTCKIANWFASCQLGFLTIVYIQCSDLLATSHSEIRG